MSAAAFCFPSAETITAARVGARLAEPPAARDAAPQDVKATTAMLRERATEDADDLTLWIEAQAGHFDCPALLDPGHRIRLQTTFRELRHIVHQRRAEAERQSKAETLPA